MVKIAQEFNRFRRFDRCVERDVSVVNILGGGERDYSSDICDSCCHDPDTGWGGFTDNSFEEHKLSILIVRMRGEMWIIDFPFINLSMPYICREIIPEV